MTKSILKKIPLLQSLDDHYLEMVMTIVDSRVYQPGQMLFKRGRDAGEWYFLVSGEVDLIDRDFNKHSVKVDVGLNLTPLNEETGLYSCIAKGQVKAIVLNRHAVNKIIEASRIDWLKEGSASQDIEVQEIDDHVSQDWMSALLGAPLLRRIPASKVQELFGRFETVEVKASDTVIKEGEVGDYFYVLAEGTAFVTNRCETVDITINPGDFFGEEALLGKTSRNATVKMFTDGVLKRLDAQSFADLLIAPVLNYIDESQLSEMQRDIEILDVKMPFEYRLYHQDGSVNLPLPKLRQRLRDLDQSKVYLIPNDSGQRAEVAAHLMCQAGYEAMILKNAC